jgi:two-component system sensor histidine kinase AgrC
MVVDIDDKTGKKLSSITEDKIRVLTKLLGIYLDNAIEASSDTDKKLVTLELYKLKDDIKIVVSNSYNEDSNIINKEQKGVSTKGKGRGNGLYFASKLVSKNRWITTNQKTVDEFYIQELIISFKQKEKV